MSPDLHLIRCALIRIQATQDICARTSVMLTGEPSMQTHGVSHRDYERLPNDTKLKVITMLEAMKTDLQHHGFSLKFLGFDGRWKDLTPWKFLGLSEDHYRRQIAGAKWVRPQPREDLLEQLDQLYNLVKQVPKIEQRSLEFWAKE